MFKYNISIWRTKKLIFQICIEFVNHIFEVLRNFSLQVFHSKWNKKTPDE
jgi:hypothetical protein